MKLAWGREGSRKRVLVSVIHSGILLDNDPEVQARKLPEKPFSYKLFSLHPKTSNDQNITHKQKCACRSL